MMCCILVSDHADNAVLSVLAADGSAAMSVWGRKECSPTFAIPDTVLERLKINVKAYTDPKYDPGQVCNTFILTVKRTSAHSSCYVVVLFLQQTPRLSHEAIFIWATTWGRCGSCSPTMALRER